MGNPERFDPDKSYERGAVRVAPETNVFAELNVEMDSKTLNLSGLVLNESNAGCALILLSKENLEEDMICFCRIGNLPNTAASIRWVKLLEEGIYKVGLEYLPV